MDEKLHFRDTKTLIEFLAENPDLIQAAIARLQAQAGPEVVVNLGLLPRKKQ